MPQKRGSRVAIALYFALLLLMLLILGIYLLNLYPLQSDFFARYLIALLFVLMLLPLIPKIKIFDMIDIKREARIFKAAVEKPKSSEARLGPVDASRLWKKK